MFHPDHVQHHHSTHFSLVVKLLNKNMEATVCPSLTNFTLYSLLSFTNVIQINILSQMLCYLINYTFPQLYLETGNHNLHRPQ